MSVTTTPIDCSPNPDPAEPRMIIWTTLRCLELQIDQHEERYNSDGVVSWELIKHMVRLAKRHAYDEGGKVIAAERETDNWRTKADEANAALLETELELQRLRKQHLDVESAERQAANAEIAKLKTQLIQAKWAPDAMGKAQGEIDSLRKERDQLRIDQQVLSHTTERLRQFAAAVQDAKRINKTLNCDVAVDSIEAALQRLETGEPVPPGLTKVKYKMCGDKIWDVQITAVNEPLSDSTGADGPGQS